MRAAEIRNLWLASSELRPAISSGDWHSARLAVEELHAMASYTTSANIRRKAKAAIQDVAAVEDLPSALREAAHEALEELM